MLEIIKKSYGMAALLIALFFFDSPIAIAMTGVFTVILSCFVNACPNKRIIGYSYLEQAKDLAPSFVISLVMFGCVLLIGYLPLNIYVLMLVQILAGIAIYLLLSAITKIKPFLVLLEAVNQKLKFH